MKLALRPVNCHNPCYIPRLAGLYIAVISSGGVNSLIRPVYQTVTDYLIVHLFVKKFVFVTISSSNFLLTWL